MILKRFSTLYICALCWVKGTLKHDLQTKLVKRFCCCYNVNKCFLQWNVEVSKCKSNKIFVARISISKKTKDSHEIDDVINNSGPTNQFSCAFGCLQRGGSTCDVSLTPKVSIFATFGIQSIFHFTHILCYNSFLLETCQKQLCNNSLLDLAQHVFPQWESKKGPSWQLWVPDLQSADPNQSEVVTKDEHTI